MKHAPSENYISAIGVRLPQNLTFIKQCFCQKLQQTTKPKNFLLWEKLARFPRFLLFDEKFPTATNHTHQVLAHLHGNGPQLFRVRHHDQLHHVHQVVIFCFSNDFQQFQCYRFYLKYYTN